MHLRRIVVAIALAGLIGSGLGACHAAEEMSAADKLAAIQKDYSAAEAAFHKAVAALEDNEEKWKKYHELFDVYDKAQGERFAAAVEVAKADPNSEVAVAALDWVLSIPRSHYLPAGLPAMEEVTKHHAANVKIGKLVAWVGRFPPNEAEDPKAAAAATAMIEAVLKDNPDRAVRAQAALAKASRAKTLYDAAAYSNRPDADALAAAAEAAYEALVKEYGECPRLIREGLGTVGELAQRELFELRNLRVGKVAPEIEGEGVDGRKFKLTDYRGNVVALIFWANWCGACMAQLPHEREMTERFKGKQFTIVGVNGDDKREKAAEVMAKEKMTWPSFWNGSGGADGPITRSWNVRLWPTVYVLDAEGVIRAKHVHGKELEEKVAVLLEELRADK